MTHRRWAVERIYHIERCSATSMPVDREMFCPQSVQSVRSQSEKRKIHFAKWEQFRWSHWHILTVLAFGQGHANQSTRTWINTFEYSIGCSAVLMPSLMPNLMSRLAWVFSLFCGASIFYFCTKNHNKNSSSKWIFLFIWRSKANYDCDFCERFFFSFSLFRRLLAFDIWREEKLSLLSLMWTSRLTLTQRFDVSPKHLQIPIDLSESFFAVRVSVIVQSKYRKKKQ